MALDNLVLPIVRYCEHAGNARIYCLQCQWHSQRGQWRVRWSTHTLVSARWLAWMVSNICSFHMRTDAGAFFEV